jgi:hypothetical protein
VIVLLSSGNILAYCVNPCRMKIAALTATNISDLSFHRQVSIYHYLQNNILVYNILGQIKIFYE